MQPIRQVIFKQFGKLYMTDENNFNSYIQDASKIIKLDGFKNYEEVAEYMWKWKHITRDYLIDRTGEEV